MKKYDYVSQSGTLSGSCLCAVANCSQKWTPMYVGYYLGQGESELGNPALSHFPFRSTLWDTTGWSSPTCSTFLINTVSYKRKWNGLVRLGCPAKVILGYGFFFICYFFRNRYAYIRTSNGFRCVLPLRHKSDRGSSEARHRAPECTHCCET